MPKKKQVKLDIPIELFRQHELGTAETIELAEAFILLQRIASKIDFGEANIAIFKAPGFIEIAVIKTENPVNKSPIYGVINANTGTNLKGLKKIEIFEEGQIGFSSKFGVI
jgi:hypothetical protein